MGIAVFPAPGGGVTQKVQEFTSTGTFTVPSNCSSISVFLVGGGGGSGFARTTTTANHFAGSGAGGGGGVVNRSLVVTPGTSYTVTIGGGGAGATSVAVASFGSDTTFGSLATAFGGGGGGSVDRNANSNSPASTRATSGGSPVFNNNVPGQSGSGGGAGGNSYVPHFFSNPSGAMGSGQYGLAPTSNTQTLLQGGTGWIASNPADGNSFVNIAGIGIDGYGGGGAGASTWNSGSAASNGPQSLGATVGGLIDRQVTVLTTNAGGTGAANSGNGAGGSAAYTGNITGTSTAVNGSTGGSGYARITFWS